MTIQNIKLDPRLKIMVSPVRIRVPPLLKVLQIAEKERASAVLLRLIFRGVSTAGSRKGLFWGEKVVAKLK
jgi:hypothetical protein